MVRKKKIRILLADDQTLIRQLLHSSIGKESDFEIVGEVSTGKKLVSLVETKKADVLLINLFIPETDGLQTITMLRQRFPLVQIVVILKDSERAYISKLIRLGAKGLISNFTTEDELSTAVRTVVQGKKYLSPQIEQKTDRENTIFLTVREIELVKLLHAGYTKKELAEKLHISRKTVESHRGNIFKKLQIKNMTELIKYAHENKLLSEEKQLN